MGEQTPEPLLIPYRELGFGGARPYLFLHVTGVDGQARVIPGLIDSGADSSVLPAGYAPLLGYGRADLDRVEGTQVGGSVTGPRTGEARLRRIGVVVSAVAESHLKCQRYASLVSSRGPRVGCRALARRRHLGCAL